MKQVTMELVPRTGVPGPSRGSQGPGMHRGHGAAHTQGARTDNYPAPGAFLELYLQGQFRGDDM